MKRLLLGLSVAALVALAACSSSPPSTTLNGKLSANTRQEEVAAKRTTTTKKRTTTTRRTGTTRTTRTTRPRSTTTRNTTPPTTPATPTTMSQTGVAGAVLYESACASDRPCTLQPGVAQVSLVNKAGKVVASTNSRSNGAFVLPAPPGNYTLTGKTPAKKGTCTPVAVTVSDGGYTNTTITCRNP
jgi:hypothetical protein